MDANVFRNVLKTALPADKVVSMARALKVVERQSLIAIDQLVTALVLVARTPSGGRQADVLRAYVEATSDKPVRGAFYARFNDELDQLMTRLLDDSLTAIRAEPVLLPPCIDGVKDWLAIDSETVKLHPSLKDKFPGTGDYAAVKIHKTYSLGRHNIVDYHFSPAKEHDSCHLTVDDSLKDYGLLFDLAYPSHKRLRTCIEKNVRFVCKLKRHWKVAIENVHEGNIRELIAGADLADAISFGQLSCRNGVIDVQARLSLNQKPYSLRVVAIEVPDHGLCVFLTNLPRERYPANVVGDLYRLRWEIEKSNKVEKSDLCLDELDCRKVCSARTMLTASLLGACIVGRLVHADHQALAQDLATHGCIKRGPVHARLVAMFLASMTTSISARLRDEPHARDWATLAELAAHASRDPNWRRRPSVLDTLLGFVAEPGRPRCQKSIRNCQDSITGVSN